MFLPMPEINNIMWTLYSIFSEVLHASIIHSIFLTTIFPHCTVVHNVTHIIHHEGPVEYCILTILHVVLGALYARGLLQEIRIYGERTGD